MNMKYKVLSIAGFDGSGGAGLQADLKTFSALGCYGMNVLTALPVQNTQGVRAVYDIPLSCIEEQLHAIFDDVEVNAIKIGMLHRADIIVAIAEIVKNRAHCPIVLDPVMIAKSGHRLLQTDAIDALKQYLFPLATIITPNLPEAEDLLNEKIINSTSMPNAAKKLLAFGSQFVLLKGGHLLSDQASDILIGKQIETWFSSPRIATKNTHGTGCTLSAAIAACLAMQYEVTEAVDLAKCYLSHAMQAAATDSVGLGHGPVHHFYHLWPSIEKI